MLDTGDIAELCADFSVFRDYLIMREAFAAADTVDLAAGDDPDATRLYSLADLREGLASPCALPKDLESRFASTPSPRLTADASFVGRRA